MSSPLRLPVALRGRNALARLGEAIDSGCTGLVSKERAAIVTKRRCHGYSTLAHARDIAERLHSVCKTAPLTP